MLRAQLEIVRMEHEKKVLESLIDDNSYELWSALRRQSEDGFWVPVASFGDRARGRNYPFWQTPSELAELRQKSRVVCVTNAHVKGLLRNLTNYVIGKGFSYQVSSKELSDTDSEAIKGWITQIQDVVDRFLETNHWNSSSGAPDSLVVNSSRERECFRRLIRDGEVFLRFFYQDDGTTLVRFVEPEQVQDPPGAALTTGWSFGIRHQMSPYEDVEVPLEYHLVYLDSTHGAQGELVPAGQILHLKGPDTDSTVKRGSPEFSWDTLDAFLRASKLQRNLSLGAAIRAATAEIWQYASGTQAQISALASSLSEYSSINPVTGNVERVERIAPGTIRRIPAGQQLVGQPPDQTMSYIQGVQADLRQGASSLCAPEYLVSADASNGNYSSTKEASAPFVKAGESWQEYLVAAFSRVLWKAISWAAQCGKLPREALAKIDLQVKGPAVLHRNEIEKAQIDQILVGIGAKDRQTVSAEWGLDPELVQANNDLWNQRNVPNLPPLDMPPE
jgi:hypothetical protein